ncbi:Uncharacterised protein [uncultured archaeon]|nr:Uncharacterised protein [uncultured archaeon]
MEIPNSLVYGMIFTGAFGAGAYKGYCSSQGIALGAGVEPLTTYGIPIAGAGIGAFTEEQKGGDYNFGAPIGLTVGGLGALVCEGVGYGAGYLAGRLSN